MKNNKNIDRLFQEKFKDFETEPNEQTWPNIQAALKEEKEERRVLPIWFKYTGIAAAFLLGFFALNTIYKTTTEPEKTIALNPTIADKSTPNTNSIVLKTFKDVKKLDLKNQPEITKSNDNNFKSYRKKSNSFSTTTEEKNNKTPTQYQNSYAVYQKEHNRPLKENKLVKGATDSETTIAEKSNTKTPIAISIFYPNKYEIVGKDKTDTKIAVSNPEIKESATPQTVNELEEILKEKEKESKKTKNVAVNSKNKWEILPNIAPIYLNTNSNGSAIDPTLSKNDKTSDTGFSYGIGVNYALSKKIALRSGINAFSVGYNTNNVTYAAGLNTTRLANVNYNSNKGVEIESPLVYNALTPAEKDILKTSTGSINQKMGYYEIPFELSYAILDKKFGVKIIGGVSTLFLKKNEIGIVSTDSNIKLGEANNLNSFHYSTNFGVGFKYKFVESFQFHFEPMLKYQVNTYSNQTGNFQPVFIGLYSGISYQF